MGDDAVVRLVERLGPSDDAACWVDVQDEVAEAATGRPPDERARLARALLGAVLRQRVYGSRDVVRLHPDAFALLLDAVPEDLAAALAPRLDHDEGGRCVLLRLVWTIPGPEGLVWMGRLIDAGAQNRLGDVELRRAFATWPDEDWSGRIDALAPLPDEVAGNVRWALYTSPPPRVAAPAQTRAALAHGRDETDEQVRWIAGNLRDLRTGNPAADVDLVDWEAGRSRPELFRWLLELAGEPGARPGLVDAALAAGRVDADTAAWLRSPLDRPAWADGEVPWELDTVEPAGEVRLPDGWLAGGDPWWSGGGEGLRWIVELPPGTHPVSVAVARHPLHGRECAALHLMVGARGPVTRWELERTDSGLDGYTAEVGVAGFGSIEAYHQRLAAERAESFLGRRGAAWSGLDGGALGSMVMCAVGPQHQQCRTWVGYTEAGEPAAVVTDLGLLDLDPERAPLPWARPGA